MAVVGGLLYMQEQTRSRTPAIRKKAITLQRHLYPLAAPHWSRALTHLSQIEGMILPNTLILLCPTVKGRHYKPPAGNGVQSLVQGVPARPV